ncbi:competence type IV pilus minor pilin ComGE [Lactococcus allomyrinae]|uniref:Competence protein comGE n=1 Tax=Lactococcus allomyrinae TaxID=2419773 RepID=A0A387BJK4_9LACT|nr:competence type IV pilus minor pilin ComGE [Lactococcus allomyrinae]AYG01206.1 competence protein comGE [Lactococcus allomyrinae]
MENLRKRSVKAYLLLESLITLALLSVLVSVVLTEVVNVRQQLTEINQQIEGLNVAKMATDSSLSKLSVNGAVIKITKGDKRTVVTNHGKELLRLEIKN